MGNAIKCVYENGFFKPLSKVVVKDDAEITIRIVKRAKRKSVIKEIAKKLEKEPYSEPELVEQILELTEYGDIS